MLGLVDGNNFYASCERVFDPSLRGRPVVVLSNIAGLPAATRIYHWGDIDEGGFRIAATLAADVLEQGRSLQPWQMSPSSVPKQAQKTAAPTAALARMSYWAGMAGWNAIAADLTDHPYRLEQEALDPVLPG